MLLYECSFTDASLGKAIKISGRYTYDSCDDSSTSTEGSSQDGDAQLNE